MNNLFTKFSTFFSENKKLLIPFIPLVFFILFFITLVFFTAFSPQQTSRDGQNTLIPTKTDNASSPSLSQTPTQTEQNNSPYHGEIILYEDNPNLEKKETLPDNATRYTIKSDVANRPDIFVVRGEDQNDVFTRSVSDPINPPILSSYIDVFGSPTQILQGSKFYGQNAQWYIYSTIKMAFVTKNNQVLEVHSFPGMTIQTYLSQYNDDLIK